MGKKGDWRIFRHNATRLRASFLAGILEYAEVSLPRVLYGHNSRLIASQNALNHAVNVVSSLLDEITQPARSEPIYTRIDLVWQIGGDIKEFLLAYRNARTRFVRKPAIIYTDSGLRWQGRGFVLNLYEKTLRETKKPGHIIRIEAQLRGKALERHLGNDIKHLRFRRLYRAYRKILLSLNPTAIPRLTRCADILAFAERNGIPLVDYWAIGKSPITVRRVRKEVAVRQIEYARLNPKTLFPLPRPPRAVHLFQR